MIINTTLERIYIEFLEYVYQDKDYKISSFKTDNRIDNWENYKYELHKSARDKLKTFNWDIKKAGKGNILNYTKEAITEAANYKGKQQQNNLIDWRKKDDFSNLENNKQLEIALFNFIKHKEKNDEKSFNYFVDLDLSYQMIAFLFFLKDKNKYLPISQERFDFIFKEAGLNFKTSGRLSWENYQEYVSIIKNVQQFLKSKNIETNLIDAHSFLWIWGWNKKEEIEQPKIVDKKSDINKTSKNEKLKSENEQIADNINDSFVELDDEYFLKRLQAQMEKGHTAEKIVLEHEKLELIKIGRHDLAEKVELVGGKIGLGYDIASYEADKEKSIEKQIEVKSVSKGKTKRFFLTRNELHKSRELQNYYIFLVENSNFDEPSIIKIKHPNILSDKSNFQFETVSYEVKYRYL